MWFVFILRSGESAPASVIMGIANSIVSIGFRPEETVVSRDAGFVMCQLRCGDGMKRVLAGKLVSHG